MCILNKDISCVPNDIQHGIATHAFYNLVYKCEKVILILESDSPFPSAV